jgi:GNAT superfamily N-acetyltransferase
MRETIQRMSLRVATVADIDAMHKVRLAVRENRLSRPDRIGPDDYRSMLDDCGRGWVYEIDGEIVGFAVADHSRRNVWALFVAPGFERRGIGKALHDRMVAWLFEKSGAPVWLTTAPDTRAEKFYLAAGWRRGGIGEDGELRLELMQEDG